MDCRVHSISLNKIVKYFDGQWQGKRQLVEKADKTGRFIRQTSSVRNWITPDGRPGPTGRGGFAAEAGRYHLYVALICPWACRTLMTRMIKGLERHITISIVSPIMTHQGWQFGQFGFQSAILVE